jgi:hypothetical protein
MIGKNISACGCVTIQTDQRVFKDVHSGRGHAPPLTQF